MAGILSIESSTRVCSVAIHDKGILVGTQIYHLEHSHSSLLPEIIRQLLANCNLKVEDLDAIAVSIGPGSYTGLRIGVSTAKGLSYVKKIPLIGLDTLEIMCQGIQTSLLPPESLLCPMIDARRMEVYCMVRDIKNQLIWDSQPLIIEEDCFSVLEPSPIYFFGNGAGKCKPVLNASSHSYIENVHPEAQYMGLMAYEKFKNTDFEDLAYLEPNYLKAYRTNKPAVKFTL